MALDEHWCKIRRDKVRFPDGRICDDYFLAVRPDVAIVFALSQRGTVPLVRQYKHGAGEITLELPAGLVAEEPPEETALRELAEETGWGASEITCVAKFFDDAGKNTNIVHCLVALDAHKVTGQMLDENEASSGLEVVEVGIDEIERFLLRGDIKSQSSVAAAYQALAWLRDKDYY
jgi:8-oxo-dGTP pyrophosphatase MutT (NUDIX family)